jgi:hypothetical protein
MSLECRPSLFAGYKDRKLVRIIHLLVCVPIRLFIAFQIHRVPRYVVTAAAGWSYHTLTSTGDDCVWWSRKAHAYTAASLALVTLVTPNWQWIARWLLVTDTLLMPLVFFPPTNLNRFERD